MMGVAKNDAFNGLRKVQFQHEYMHNKQNVYLSAGFQHAYNTYHRQILYFDNLRAVQREVKLLHGYNNTPNSAQMLNITHCV